jgi:hypothetical protein
MTEEEKAKEEAEAKAKTKAEEEAKKPKVTLVEVILDGTVWYENEEYLAGETLGLPEAEADRLRRKKVAHLPEEKPQPAPKKRR